MGLSLHKGMMCVTTDHFLPPAIMWMYAYAAQKIADELKKDPSNTFHSTVSRVGSEMWRSGLRLKLDKGFELSIQTEPMVAATCFSETALFQNGEIVLRADLGYKKRCIKHPEPEDLFAHIQELKQRIQELPEETEISLAGDAVDSNSEQHNEESSSHGARTKPLTFMDCVQQ